MELPAQGVLWNVACVFGIRFDYVRSGAFGISVKDHACADFAISDFVRTVARRLALLRLRNQWIAIVLAPRGRDKVDTCVCKSCALGGICFDVMHDTLVRTRAV